MKREDATKDTVMQIVVTGAMGTGKSTLMAWLAKHLPDYEFFNVDTLVAQLYDDPFFVADVLARFGVSDRKSVSKIVFEDAEARTWLEELANNMLASKLVDIKARPRVVVEFPLLFEMATPYADFDVVLATWCPAEVQRERIFARDDRDVAHTERMLAAQMDAELKVVLADIRVEMTEEPDESLLAQLEFFKTKKMLKNRCEQFFDSKAVWPVLEALYDSPEREAHGLTYLARFFHRFDKHCGLVADARAMELAAWFHLAGLSLTPGGYGKSPIRSTKLMWKVLSQAAPHWLTYPSPVPLATELIACLSMLDVVGTHVQSKPQWAADARLFVDLVMLEYGMSQDDLDAYWEGTRAELAGLPGVRANLAIPLMALISREKLLQTEALAQIYEDTVRDGLNYLLTLEPSRVGYSDEQDEGAEAGMPFNQELHDMQARVFAGEDVFGPDAEGSAASTAPELPAWPAEKQTKPYDQE